MTIETPVVTPESKVTEATTPTQTNAPVVPSTQSNSGTQTNAPVNDSKGVSTPETDKTAANADGSLLGDAKTPDQKSGDAPTDAKKVEEPQQKQGAPEKYADFKLPEGIKLDAALAEKFTASAKKLGLSQDAAQELVSLQAEHALAEMKSRLDWYQEQRAAWKKDTIAALGPKYQEELGFAAKALDRFGSPELRKLLTDTGLGDNKELAVFLVKAGKAMAEDQPLGGKEVGKVDDVEAIHRSLFPTMYRDK